RPLDRLEPRLAGRRLRVQQPERANGRAAAGRPAARDRSCSGRRHAFPSASSPCAPQVSRAVPAPARVADYTCGASEAVELGRAASGGVVDRLVQDARLRGGELLVVEEAVAAERREALELGDDAGRRLMLLRARDEP